MAAIDGDPEAIIDLDPNGDIILSVNGPDSKYLLRCTSQILKLSSSVFSRMLSPGFKEGDQLQASRSAGEVLPLTINLTEDFPQAMMNLLRYLHHTGHAELSQCSLSEAAAIAVQADKYACQSSLLLWFQTQVAQAIAAENPTDNDLVCLLIIITKFRGISNFRAAVSFVQWHIEPSLESAKEIISWRSHLDASDIILYRTNADAELCTLQTRVYKAQGLLRCSSARLKLRNVMALECPKKGNSCIRDQAVTRGLRSCHQKVEHCTPEFRVTLLFNALERVELWPDAQVFCRSSIRVIWDKIRKARSTSDHGCSIECPLTMELDKIIKEIKELLTH